VVVQKNNFENFIASGQMLYKRIHHCFQKKSNDKTIEFCLSRDEFNQATLEEGELYFQKKLYDIQSHQIMQNDCILVKCQLDEWDTYLTDIISIFQETNSHLPFPIASHQAKTWYFEILSLLILLIEKMECPAFHYPEIHIHLPTHPWINKIKNPPIVR
jgi:hypothetical protein